MSASPLNRRSAALYGAELTQPGYQQRIAESQIYSPIELRVISQIANNVTTATVTEKNGSEVTIFF
jgi:hypothetical protein